MLSGWWSLLLCTATSHRGQLPTTHSSKYQPVCRSNLSSTSTTHDVTMVPQVLQQPRAPTFYALQGRQQVQPRCCLHAGADGAQATGIVEVHPSVTANVTHISMQKASKSGHKCADSITSIWSLAKERWTWRLSRVQMKVHFHWNT